MKLSLILFHILMSGIFSVSFAQGTGNESYDELLAMSNIRFQMPEGFHSLEIERGDTLSINPNYVPKYGHSSRNIGWVYPFGAESDAKDCVFLYPIVYPGMIDVDNVIEDEIQAYLSDSDADARKYVSTVSNPDILKPTNADTALIYNFELKIPYREKYTHAVGVCLKKDARGSLLLKMILDDNGLKKKDEYLESLLKSINYGGDSPRSDIK